MIKYNIESSEIGILMAFNGAVVTCRLYPTSAPQVKTSMERAYNLFGDYLSKHDSFSLAMVDGSHAVNHKVIPQRTLDGLINLVVYRQLQLLGLQELLFEQDLDRFTFSQIVSVFVAKREKIEKEGGGREYVTALGLISCFREKFVGTLLAEKEKTKIKALEKLIEVLLGKTDIGQVRVELEAVLANEAMGAELLAAGIGRLLGVLSKRKGAFIAEEFNGMFVRVSELVAGEGQRELAVALAKLLVVDLQIAALAALLGQDFSSVFGQQLYDALVRHLSVEQLIKVQKLYQYYIARFEKTHPKSHKLAAIKPAYEHLGDHERVKAFWLKQITVDALQQAEAERLNSRMSNMLALLLGGKYLCLSNNEFLQNLPDLILSLAQEEDERGGEVLRVLADKLTSLQGEKQRNLATSLVLVGEKLLLEKKWKWLRPIRACFVSWLKKSNVGDALYERIASILSDIMLAEKGAGFIEEFDELLLLFYQLRNNEIKKDATVQAIIARVQDRAIDRKSLPVGLADCLLMPDDVQVSRRLVWQGPIAIRYLIDELISSEKTEQRLKIIDLLLQGKVALPPVIFERLDEDMPWYGKRNLIKLLGNTGSEEHVEKIFPYIKHRDLRVQREVCLCLSKIGGSKKKELLLQAIQQADDVFRIQLIQSLGPLVDEEVATALVQLLGELAVSREVRSAEIILAILKVLKKCPFLFVVEALTAFLDLRQEGGAFLSKDLWRRVEQVRDHLAALVAQNGKGAHVGVNELRKNKQRQISRMTTPSAFITEDHLERQALNAFEEGEQDQGGRLLLKLISKLACNGKFSEADKVRDLLIETAPYLLTDIIRAAEIIEEEKANSIDKGHVEIWHELYDFLTTEEFSVLYHRLQHKRLFNDEVIVSQGDVQKSLYFINSGKVKLFYKKQEAEVLIKTLSRCSVLGAGAFFDASVWTFAVSSLGRVDISVLDFKDIQELAEEYPSLESKLHDFCVKFEKIENFFKSSKNDRRQNQRVKVSGRISSHLCDNQGRRAGVMPKGGLSDISAGGISFFIRLSRKAHAQVLLGRMLRVQLPDADGEVALMGEVVAVHALQNIDNEYSVHVQFEQTLGASLFKGILLALKRKKMAS
ncbi:HEAT repeat domain-containing protein [Desulfotalea psychrophila]|uniref:Cyclic nucleotide-binding domain-containing protein n=1 Tax=Desulfotalea psychrophila (strain LSv54 / DSM 12343) TaxID=177439 RepID=Q6AMI4_DESPS|nr:HEAT repeat domain-containing protein [Desulfotalea psychrophila]CAG36441.1 hypothetical protein DP1712 [Desulfotalea psychrophila LSv54]